jgi:hypothetical protein
MLERLAVTEYARTLPDLARRLAAAIGDRWHMHEFPRQLRAVVRQALFLVEASPNTTGSRLVAEEQEFWRILTAAAGGEVPLAPYRPIFDNVVRNVVYGVSGPFSDHHHDLVSVLRILSVTEGVAACESDLIKLFSLFNSVAIRIDIIDRYFLSPTNNQAMGQFLATIRSGCIVTVKAGSRAERDTRRLPIERKREDVRLDVHLVYDDYDLHDRAIMYTLASESHACKLAFALGNGVGGWSSKKKTVAHRIATSDFEAWNKGLKTQSLATTSAAP